MKMDRFVMMLNESSICNSELFRGWEGTHGGQLEVLPADCYLMGIKIDKHFQFLFKSLTNLLQIANP